jgi:hypothetical protein
MGTRPTTLSVREMSSPIHKLDVVHGKPIDLRA